MYNPSQATAQIQVTKIPTAIGIKDLPSPIYEGQPFVVEMTLYDTSTFPYTRIPGKTLHVSYINQTTGAETFVGDVVTDENGDASIEVVIPKADTYVVRADFDGDETYASSWHETPEFTVHPAIDTALTISAPAKVIRGEVFTVSGVLTRVDTGEGIEGQTVFLSYNGTEVGSAVTDVDGAYSFSISIPQLGTFTLKVSYPGSGSMGPSSAIRTMRVEAVEIPHELILAGLFVVGIAIIAGFAKGHG